MPTSSSTPIDSDGEMSGCLRAGPQPPGGESSLDLVTPTILARQNLRGPQLLSHKLPGQLQVSTFLWGNRVYQNLCYSAATPEVPLEEQHAKSSTVVAEPRNSTSVTRGRRCRSTNFHCRVTAPEYRSKEQHAKSTSVVSQNPKLTSTSLRGRRYRNQLPTLSYLQPPGGDLPKPCLPSSTVISSSGRNGDFQLSYDVAVPSPPIEMGIVIIHPQG